MVKAVLKFVIIIKCIRKFDVLFGSMLTDCNFKTEKSGKSIIKLLQSLDAMF